MEEKERLRRDSELLLRTNEEEKGDKRRKKWRRTLIYNEDRKRRWRKVREIMEGKRN